MNINPKDNPFVFSPSVVLLPLLFVLILWFVYWYEIHYHVSFAHYGIYPRETFGLKGIFASPFLHSNLKHLFNNSIPLFVLLMALRYFYREQAFTVIILGILFSGLGTWLIGRPSYHIGASGLVYVLVSFIFFKGIFTKYYRLIALSLLIVMLYGGMIWYMFPKVDDAISWEGHLFGFITGFVISVLLRTPQFGKQLFYDWESPNFNPELDPFMKNFDENGSFSPPPKPEEVVKDYFTTSIKVIYNFIGIKKE
jgi:membrane associated rhomboid family serine protease